MSQLGQINGGLLGALSVSPTPVSGAEGSISLENLDGSFSNLLAKTEDELLSLQDLDTFAEFEGLELSLDPALDSAQDSSAELTALAGSTATTALPVEVEPLMELQLEADEKGSLLPPAGQPLPVVSENHKLPKELQSALQTMAGLVAEAGLETQNQRVLPQTEGDTTLPVTPEVIAALGMQDIQKLAIAPVAENTALLQEQNLKQQGIRQASILGTGQVKLDNLGVDVSQNGVGQNSNKQELSPLLQNQQLQSLQTPNQHTQNQQLQNQNLAGVLQGGETPSQAFAKVIESSFVSSEQPLAGSESGIDKGGAILAKLQSIPVSYRSFAGTTQASTYIQTPVATPQWGDAVAERMVWFSVKSVASAELKLDPPELGPLQVRITTQGDQTNITFTSQHLAVRDALDQSLPRLREIFSENGLNLSNVDVSEQGGERQNARKFDAEGNELAGSGSSQDDQQGAAEGDISEGEQEVAGIQMGLVDDYA